MNTLAAAILAKERKAWRKNPLFGFAAKPVKNENGTLNVMQWDCIIPGEKGTPWENGLYNVRLLFDKDYPHVLPLCNFTPPIFHPNVHPFGRMCLTVLEEQNGWIPMMDVKNILLSIQKLLSHPSLFLAINTKAFDAYCANRAAYEENVRKEAAASKASATSS